MLLPAITESFQNKLRTMAHANDYSGVTKVLSLLWNSIPRNFRKRYLFTLLFFVYAILTLLAILLIAPGTV